MTQPKLKFNKPCPGHSHYCWAYRHLMREDAVLCAKCYKRLPDHIKKHMYLIFKDIDIASNLSIIVDWLLENELPYECGCSREVSSD